MFMSQANSYMGIECDYQCMILFNLQPLSAKEDGQGQGSKNGQGSKKKPGQDKKMN